MPVQNTEIADIFNKTADLLEIKGENQFRVRAYRDAARTVRGLSRSAVDMIDEDADFTKLPGIGKDLAGKIETVAGTGSLPLLEDLENELPGELSDLTHVAGLGPKRVRALYEQLDISSIDDLREAAENGDISRLEGFGKKTAENILDEIERMKESGGRMRLADAEQIMTPLFEHVKSRNGVKECVVAGSYRRRKETVGDIDILATVKRGTDIMEAFTSFEDVDRVIARGDTKSTVILRSGLQVDLRVVQQVSYGAAMHYFTGSKAHNIAVRKRGQADGLKINEYGVFKNGDRIAGKTEQEVYDSVGLPYIEPELRENRGEIEAAENGELPSPVTLDDIRGDLHVHTDRTDGHFTLEQMVDGARKRGYEYIAITEHSKKVTVAHGLTADDLREQVDEIDELNDSLKGFTVLKGIEVDILEDGSLDLPDEVLKKLDLTVCSVHSKFNLSKNKQTERVLRAMENDYFRIFAHPTGRYINEREPYDIDLEKILEKAKELGRMVEINAHPERLDLNDVHSKMAKDMGVKLVISTDAHSLDDYDHMRYGVGQARRGWLEARDVLNTMAMTDVKKTFA